MDKLYIYQIKKDDPQRIMFEGSRMLKDLGLSIDRANYDLVYECELKEGMDDLEDIYYIFNCDRPEDFKGHSLSVSDIVAIEKKGEIKAYFCDSIGFLEVPDFCLRSETL